MMRASQDSSSYSRPLVRIDMDDQKRLSHSKISVNPLSFLAAYPDTLRYKDGTIRKSDPYGCLKSKEVVRMRFSQGSMVEEFYVEPHDATMFLGFSVGKAVH